MVRKGVTTGPPQELEIGKTTQPLIFEKNKKRWRGGGVYDYTRLSRKF